MFIPASNFAELHADKIDYLYIQDSNFSIFPADFFAKIFPKLNFIEMYSVNMTVLDANSFTEAKNLQQLSIYVSNIDHLKGGFFRIIGTLLDIELAFCQIGTVSLSVLEGVNKGRVIGFTDNKIYEVSQELYDSLVRLQGFGIDMNGNDINNSSTISYLPLKAPKALGSKSNIGTFFLIILLALAILGIAATLLTGTRRHDSQLIIVLSELNANLAA